MVSMVSPTVSVCFPMEFLCVSGALRLSPLNQLGGGRGGKRVGPTLDNNTTAEVVGANHLALEHVPKTCDNRFATYRTCQIVPMFDYW